MYLVDSRGIVIDEYGPQYADLDLPIVDGLGAKAKADSAPETMTDESRADLAARVIGALKVKPAVAAALVAGGCERRAQRVRDPQRATRP